MDKRRGQHFVVDVFFPFSDTYERLHQEFGAAGPLCFIHLLAAAKRAPIQGTVSYISAHGFWQELGVYEDDQVDLDAFLTLLGRIKQCSRRASRRGVTDVRLTNFVKWQNMPRNFKDAERKRSARQALREHNSADDSADTAADGSADDLGARDEYEDEHIVCPLPVDEGNNATAADSTNRSAASAAHHQLIKRVTLEARELAERHTNTKVATLIGDRHPSLTPRDIVTIVNTIYRNGSLPEPVVTARPPAD